MARPARAVRPVHAAIPPGEQIAAAARVGQPAQRKSGEGEDHGEQGDQAAELRVGEEKFAAQRFENRVQRLAIVEVEDIDQKENGQCRSNRFGSHWPNAITS